MGEKGSRQTSAGAEAAETLVSDLQPLGGVTSKKMFGGHGVFLDGLMFAIVDSQGHAFFRADDETRQQFVDAGSEAHGRMPYWTIPAGVLTDEHALVEWGREAAEAARRAKSGR